MAEAKPAGTIELGDNAYLFPSPVAASTEVFVMAHGGSIDITRKFDVPGNVTVAFFVKGNQANYGPGGPLGFITTQMDNKDLGRTIGEPDDRAYTYTGRACPDYILSKAFGTHWKTVATRASYRDVRDEMDSRNPGNGPNWVPHIVTVRNRKALGTNQNIWLSALIAAIIKAMPNTTRIYCGNCRSDASADAKKHKKTVGAPKLNSQKNR